MSEFNRTYVNVSPTKRGDIKCLNLIKPIHFYSMRIEFLKPCVYRDKCLSLVRPIFLVY